MRLNPRRPIGAVAAWLTVALLAVGVAWPASAAETDLRTELQNRVTYFYRNPEPGGVPDTLRILDENGMLAKDGADVDSPLIGFLAALFERYPEHVERWTAVDYSRDVQRLIGYGLVQAGMAERSAAFLRRNGWPAEVIDMIGSAPDSILSMPIVTAAQLDMLWGASFATGDRRYPERLLDYVAETLALERYGVEDIADVGRPENLRGHRNPQLEKMFGRYEREDAMRLVVVASAVWALGSNAKQHVFVMEAVQDRIAAGPDSDLGYLLRKSIFRSTADRLSYIESRRLKGMVSETADATLGERNEPTVEALSAAFAAAAEAEFAPGGPVSVAVLLLLPVGEPVEAEFGIVSPQGARATLGPFRWQAVDNDHRWAIDTFAVPPAHLGAEGVYAVHGVFRVPGQSPVTTESRFFVGRR